MEPDTGTTNGPTDTRPWAHDLDSKKYLVDVHMPFKTHLGTDYKLAKLDTDRMSKKQELIMTLIPCALMAYDLCPNKDIGEYAKNMILAHIHTLAIINFNVDNNMIVDRLTRWKQDDQEQEAVEESNWLKKRLDKITGKAKLKETED